MTTRPPAKAVDDDRDTQRYRAPALEKGLDILELISRASAPLTATMITQELGRSAGELFRMIQVLEFRGYVEQAANGGYVPTTKLFTLGMDQAPVKTLLEAALPAMRTLSDDAEQSCHLATRAAGEIVIVARMEAAALIGFSVRIGYRRPLPLTGSGTVLYAFQSFAVRERWEADFAPLLDASDLARFRRRADKVLRQGFDQYPSDIVPGIVDLSAPVFRGDTAVAALTMPFVRKNPLKMSIEESLVRIQQAAAEISSELAINDVRV